MKASLQPNESVILSSKVGAPNGKPGDLFPQLATGDLILTSDRLIFEAEKAEDTADQVIALNNVRAVTAGWVRLIDMIPLYPCVEVRTGDGILRRFASVKLGATKPAEWVAAILAAQASLPEPAPVTAGEQVAGDNGGGLTGYTPPHETGGATSAPALSLQGHRDPVHDGLGWALVAVPFAGAAFEYLAGSAVPAFVSGFLMLAANVLLTQMDIQKLTNARHDAPSGWWALIVPVYLWKRAAILQRPQIITFAWLATFVISLFVAVSNDEARLADKACPVVTDIIRNQLNGETSCRRVTITEDLGDGFYAARATLANGNSIRISIEVRGSDIYVQIPPQ